MLILVPRAASTGRDELCVSTSSRAVTWFGFFPVEGMRSFVFLNGDGGDQIDQDSGESGSTVMNPEISRQYRASLELGIGNGGSTAQCPRV